VGPGRGGQRDLAPPWVARPPRGRGWARPLNERRAKP